MNGLDKIIEHIQSASYAECDEIAREAAAECGRIKADYSKLEQAEYWKYIDAGTREVKRHSEQLSALAQAEANKLIDATHRELIDEAFALAAKELLALSKSDYARLLSRFKLPPDTSAADVVSKFRNQLTQNVSSMLFD